MKCAISAINDGGCKKIAQYYRMMARAIQRSPFSDSNNNAMLSSCPPVKLVDATGPFTRIQLNK